MMAEMAGGQIFNPSSVFGGPSGQDERTEVFDQNQSGQDQTPLVSQFAGL